ncbi:N-acetylmuramoyl-L-Ala amidase [Chlamydia pecorum PV3056/3]|uniref:LysM peptidoglycan-binding domain-containing protein n=1 Tax=Chlamydia pecorum TaxID=85991 RepID=UPI0003ADD123|nr:LysM peptidoglycan-binding domain-containing protein [Chlamydia pecorum]AGW38405.1 N-acetylmuramoyl-L-Ala amidase [Chlamydia pecorum PV3056/3]
MRVNFYAVLCYALFGAISASARTPSLQAVLAEVEDAAAKLHSHESELLLLTERLDEYDTRLHKLLSAKPEELAQKIQQLEKDQKVLAKTLATLTSSLKEMQNSLQSKLQDLQKDYKLLSQDLKFFRRSLQALVDGSTPGAFPDFSDPVPSHIYIVSPGDNLSSIAKKYKISVNELKKINKLNSDLIYTGQRLCLPMNTQ